MPVATAKKTIDHPGLYPDFDERDYHLDPCPEPSASRSIVKSMVEKTPRHGFIAHPRLNPDYEEEIDDKFNLGTAVHTALLSRGKKIVVGNFADYKTNDAKAFKAAAYRDGLLPILAPNMDRVTAMCAAVTEQLPDHGLEHLFNTDVGRAEVVMAWRDPVGGWCRAMIDWLEKDLTVTDIKTTSTEFNLDALGRHMSSMGYEWQHGFYERGLVNLHPELEGRVKFRFLFCEDKPPYSILPVLLPADAVAMGRAQTERGLAMWAEAKRTGQWPRYKGGDVTAEYPPWAVAEFAK